MGAVSRMVSSITLLFSWPSWNYPTQEQCLGEVGFPLVLETPTTPSEEKPWVPAVLSDLSSVLVGMAPGRDYPGRRPRGIASFQAPLDPANVAFPRLAVQECLPVAGPALRCFSHRENITSAGLSFGWWYELGVFVMMSVVFMVWSTSISLGPSYDASTSTG